MSKLRPVNGNIILRPIEEEEEMNGNIIIPDMGDSKPELGEVLETSDMYNFHTGDWIPTIYKKGDKVLTPKMGAQVLNLDGEEYWVVHSPTIVAIIEN